MPTDSRSPWGIWCVEDARGVRRAVWLRNWNTWEAFPEAMWIYPIVMVIPFGLTGVFVISSAWNNWQAGVPIAGPRAFLALLIWSGLTLAFCLSVVRTIRGRAPAIAAIELAAHRCPSCGYHLDPQNRQPDGCIVCPECGGAWS